MIAATQHYAEISPDLAHRFYVTMLELVAEIRESPERYRTIVPPVRRHFRLPFPYAVLYLDRPAEIVIIAVSAFKRDPGYWKQRFE